MGGLTALQVPKRDERGAEALIGGFVRSGPLLVMMGHHCEDII